MTIRVAHLSDLHFGRKFSLALWHAVRDEVTQFAPQILVVSGDLVDNPSPIQLLAAKCELRAFAEQLKAKLVVVPGNHDVYAAGNFRPRRDWFERIFYNEDTRTAEEMAAREFGEPLGFNERYRVNPQPSVGIFETFKRSVGVGSSFESFLPVARKQDLVERPENCSVLVAKLDSNKVGQPIGFATGWVDDADLVALRAKLSAISETYLVRIAVVHHHVLPIAFAGGRILGAEPFMVLHNAGTVLNLLAKHRFDLVLHGHKHVAQFARLDLSPKDETGHSMAIVSAGSCALETENDSRGNCFNLITIMGNGQIDVESFHYGGGTGPSRYGHYALYREPLSTVKRRAYVRARERHLLHSRSRTQVYEITETGDLITEATLEGLNASDADHTHCRIQGVTLPPDSWFVDSILKLDRNFSSPGVTLRVHPEPTLHAPRQPSKREFTVSFSDDTLRRGVNYRIRYACANNVNMTLWECAERNPERTDDDWDKGFIGFAVTHPIDTLMITLKLPPSLQDAHPVVQCRRPSGYPAYEIDANGDALLARESDWVVDAEMTRHETNGLHFDRRTQSWCLQIEQPLVGYQYKILWETPIFLENLPVRAEVSDQQRTILGALSGRNSSASRWPAEVSSTFKLFASETERLLGRCVEGERRSVELFVYDGGALVLRPFLAQRSWTEDPLSDKFTVPLGRGIAGVAFRQGRIIPWAMQERRSPFIKPVPYAPETGETAVEMRNILAIPIFHASHIHVDRPPPWACVGVACFASSSDGTKIANLLEPSISADSNQLILGIRGLAHATMDAIIECLDHPGSGTP